MKEGGKEEAGREGWGRMGGKGEKGERNIDGCGKKGRDQVS